MGNTVDVADFIKKIQQAMEEQTVDQQEKDEKKCS